VQVINTAKPASSVLNGNATYRVTRQQWRAARAVNSRPQAANVTAFALFAAANWAQNCMALPSTINNTHIGGIVTALVSRDDYPTCANMAQNTMFTSKGARIRETHLASKGILQPDTPSGKGRIFTRFISRYTVSWQRLSHRCDSLLVFPASLILFVGLCHTPKFLLTLLVR
jgi:hypothetical protein